MLGEAPVQRDLHGDPIRIETVFVDIGAGDEGNVTFARPRVYCATVLAGNWRGVRLLNETCAFFHPNCAMPLANLKVRVGFAT